MTRRNTRVVLTAALLTLVVPRAAAAVEFNLTAGATTLDLHDGLAPVPMWAFGDGGGGATIPGPVLRVPAGETSVVIHLTNTLPEAVSIVVPGLRTALAPTTFIDGQGRTRIRSFTAETPAGATVSYTWSSLAPGTYLYHSGTHPSKQVPMGLYGALIVEGPGGAPYPGVSAGNEALLLLSEVDRAHNQAVAGGTYGTAAFPSSFATSPAYYLVNGQPYPQGAPLVAHDVAPGETVLLRLLNAGIKSHVAAIRDSYVSVVAEDGKPYPFAREQYSVFLPAAKTSDAVLVAPADCCVAIYDRMLHLASPDGAAGGQLTYLPVVPPPLAPLAASPLAATAATSSTLARSGPASEQRVTPPRRELAYPRAAGVARAAPAAQVRSAGVPPQLIASRYFAERLANRAPRARNDVVALLAGGPTRFEVVRNDSDTDGGIDPGTVVVVTQPGRGRLEVHADGSVTYTPPPDGAAAERFTYRVRDRRGALSNTASVELRP